MRRKFVWEADANTSGKYAIEVAADDKQYEGAVAVDPNLNYTKALDSAQSVEAAANSFKPKSPSHLPSVIEKAGSTSSLKTPYVLKVGQSAQGFIAPSEADYYQVYVEGGKTYTVSLVGETSKALIDPDLQVLDSSGAVIASDDNSLPNLNAQATFKAKSSGNVYLSAQSSSTHAPSGSGKYGLSIIEGSKGWFDDYMGAGIINMHAAWATSPVKYAFRETALPEDAPSFSQANDAVIAAVATAVGFWTDVCGIDLTRKNDPGKLYSDDASILIACYNADDGFAGYTRQDSQREVRYNLNQSVDSHAILHEIGHAIGLSHPSDYGVYNPGKTAFSFENNAQFWQDRMNYTAMSYFYDGIYPSAPMLFDVMAAQDIYGPNYATRSGNTTYGYHSTVPNSLYDFSTKLVHEFCLWDGGGTDGLDCSLYDYDQKIDLRQGHFSSVLGETNNISIAYGTVIENAVGGSGWDTIYGNSADNVLTGGSGNDSLYGDDGNDTLYGGDGTDVLSGGNGRDYLMGGKGADSLYGGAGDDTFKGGTSGDLLTGGDGADRFIFSTASADLAAGLVDTISDFTTGTDKIDLTLISRQHGALVFSKAPHAGTHTVTFDAASKYLSIDWTGDGHADMKILLKGVSKVAGSDFIL